MADDPRCWYCGEPAALWCDAVIGFVEEQRQPEQLLLGEPPPPPPRRSKLQTRPATCDAAACRPCARVHGWRRAEASREERRGCFRCGGTDDDCPFCTGDDAPEESDG